jgi:Tol biopolymer transport system component
MSVSAPPRPPSSDRSNEPLDREEIEALVEALVEEARRETRRRRRRYWAVAVLVALVGLGALTLLEGGAGSQTASPSVSAQSNAATRARTSRIAFLRLRGSLATCRPGGSCDNELYVMNADGSDLRRLTRNAALGPGPSTDPVWSPDGRKLVFVKRVERGGAPCRPVGRCDNELYVMNADGSDLRRLTRNVVTDGSPVWLPDSRRIGFVRSVRDRTSRSNRDEIYVMNADGSGQRRLTLLPRRAGGLTLSPEGEKIAFVAPAGHRGAADIFVMNAAGSGLRNLTNTVTTSFDFVWSPDGRRIAYLEGSPGRGTPLSAFNPLSVVNADGTSKRRLTGPLMVDLGLPSWSPDGRTIAFTGGSVIYTVHADGTGLRKLTHGPGHNLEPRWSPDGRRILFLSVRDDLAHYAFDLFVMNADGSGQRNLTHTPGVSELGASWAPAG